MLEHSVYITILVNIAGMQEAHEAVYEVHQDQQQMQAHLAADLADQEQVSCLLNNLHGTYHVSLCETDI